MSWLRVIQTLPHLILIKPQEIDIVIILILYIIETEVQSLINILKFTLATCVHDFSPGNIIWYIIWNPTVSYSTVYKVQILRADI